MRCMFNLRGFRNSPVSFLLIKLYFLLIKLALVKYISLYYDIGERLVESSGMVLYIRHVLVFTCILYC